MGTAVSCEQFRDDVALVKSTLPSDSRSAGDSSSTGPDVFLRRSKHIANLNRMVTTEYVPEFEIHSAKL